MKLDHFNVLVDVAKLELKKQLLKHSFVRAKPTSRLPFTYIRINAGNEHDILFNIKRSSWIVAKKDTTDRVPGSRKGKSLSSAISSAQTRLKHDAPRNAMIKRNKTREKAYNKQTPANLLYKLMLASKHYTQDKLSMSKSARQADVAYETFKDYINNPKKYQIKQAIQ